MDGIALARKVAQSGSSTGVILMTGFTTELHKARDMGLLGLPKPCPAEELLARVQAAVMAAGSRTNNN